MKRVIAIDPAGGDSGGGDKKRSGFWGGILQSRGIQQNIEEKEMWRKELGEDRSLLLYIDEKGKLNMRFTDGPWVYLTEELVGRVKVAGMLLWEREVAVSK